MKNDNVLRARIVQRTIKKKKKWWEGAWFSPSDHRNKNVDIFCVQNEWHCRHNLFTRDLGSRRRRLLTTLFDKSSNSIAQLLLLTAGANLLHSVYFYHFPLRSTTTSHWVHTRTTHAHSHTHRLVHIIIIIIISFSVWHLRRRRRRRYILFSVNHLDGRFVQSFCLLPYSCSPFCCFP